MMVSLLVTALLGVTAIMGGLYIKSAVTDISKKKDHVNIVPINNNALISGERTDGYNRQTSVILNKTIYGVSNKGVTMDKRRIYTPNYNSIGL